MWYYVCRCYIYRRFSNIFHTIASEGRVKDYFFIKKCNEFSPVIHIGSFDAKQIGQKFCN